VSDETRELLEKGRLDLEAARTLIRAGYQAQAISRAYYAAFYAAEAALLRLGETRSKHAGVISGFRKRVVKEGGVDPDLGAALASLFRLRLDADYGPGPFTLAQAEGAIADAERFVLGVGAWLAGRS
jgi:uncharacterized protein (UPF0332 family)